MTQNVTIQTDREQAVEENDIAHLAGYFDSSGYIGFKVSEDDEYSLGYSFRINCRIDARDNDPSLGKMMEYADQNQVKYYTMEITQESVDTTRQQVAIRKPESVKRFLSPMANHLVSKYLAAMMTLDKIIPAIEAREHTTKQGFYELMGVVDEVRRSQGSTGVKYDQQYFADEWSLSEE